MGKLKRGETLPKNVILVGDTLTFLVTHKKKRFKRSLQIELCGTNPERKEALHLAELKAAQLRKDVLNGEFHQRKVEDAALYSVQDLLDAFDAYARGTKMTGRTITDYKSTARKFAKHFFYGTKLSKLPIDQLFHIDILRDWKAFKTLQARTKAESGEFAGVDYYYKAENAAASDSRQMKALWSTDAMESKPYSMLSYDKTTILEFKSFAIRTPTPKRFKEPSTEVRKAFLEFVARARETRPALWFACVLAGSIGLRRGDAIAARWDYITVSQEDSLIDGELKPVEVVKYEFAGSTDKRNKRGEITAKIPPETYREMLATRTSKCPYIVPFDTIKARTEVFEELVKELHAIGIDDSKPVHYLRKWLGALYASKFGIYEAATQLGNRDIKTIAARYATVLNKTNTASIL